ncbi:MAG: hypothetical protein B6230_07970 [Desulfobacteraceae bacterium 4572_89]|nr:MAG: hypothetical protein B6230_07970 [Desulfobacteraceae bacterium 4572_89]
MNVMRCAACGLIVGGLLLISGCCCFQPSSSVVASAMGDYDIIRTQAQSWLRGAEIIDVKRRDFGITEAHMSLRVNFACRKMIWWPVGIGAGDTHGRNSVVSANGVK